MPMDRIRSFRKIFEERVDVSASVTAFVLTPPVMCQRM